MKKVIMVLGCLMFSSQASANDFDCAKIKQVALSRYEANLFFYKEGESLFANNKYEDAKDFFARADEAMETSAHWATLYIAFCKNDLTH